MQKFIHLFIKSVLVLALYSFCLEVVAASDPASPSSGKEATPSPVQQEQPKPSSNPEEKGKGCGCGKKSNG